MAAAAPRRGVPVSGAAPTPDATLTKEISGLKSDIDRRQAAYIRKEREYRSRIELLERELARARGAAPADGDVDAHRVKLRQIHSTIMKNIEQVQDQTARILQEQERDLLRAFRARLFDVQTELEKANARATSGAQQYVDKCKLLEKQLEWARETADRLDRHNTALSRENGQLRTQFKTQEDDREYLVRQLVAAKKDNARLRQDLAAAQQAVFESRARAEEVEGRLAETMAASMAEGAAPGASRGGAGSAAPGSATASGRGPASWSLGGGGQAASAAASGGADGAAGVRDVGAGRLRDTVKRLRRVLDSERRALKAARQSLAMEMQSRTEVERLFRQCVADVQADVAARKAALVGAGHDAEAKADTASLESLSGADRREVMRRLLQQEEVLRRLGDATFPPRGASASASASPGGRGTARSDLDDGFRLPSLGTGLH